MKRIFAALEISEEAKIKTVELTQFMRRKFPDFRVNWERSEKLHLTLKFFGNVEDFELENIKKVAAFTAKYTKSFSLIIKGNGVFPNLQRPKILWLGVEDIKGNLIRLHKLFETECHKIGFDFDNRKFSPHLTVGRLRDTETSNEFIEEFLKRIVECKEFTVVKLKIVESFLMPQGSKYKTISEHFFESENINEQY